MYREEFWMHALYGTVVSLIQLRKRAFDYGGYVIDTDLPIKVSGKACSKSQIAPTRMGRVWECGDGE